MKLSKLVFVYTMDCPLRCDFCCHPLEKQVGPTTIRKEEAVACIKEAAEIGGVQRVVFTGGEPFLFYEELVQILGACKGLLPVRIVTSCFWAETKERAKEKLKPLIERGLDELTCSTDLTHQVFVPASFVENAIEVGLELGIMCEIASTFWDPTTKIEDIIRVPRHPRLYLHPNLAIPMGRGRHRKVSWRDYKFPYGPSQIGGCNPNGGCDVTIYPDGEVYPCCSGEFNFEGKLSFGNIKEVSLKTILERMREDAFVQLMFNHGCETLYGLARWKFPHLLSLLPKDDDLVSHCQICARVHGNSELMELLRPLLNYSKKLVEAEQRLEGHKKGGNNN